MHAYDITESGFRIALDMRLYDRSAVIKALYRFHDDYIISYEIDGTELQVFFDNKDTISDYNTVVSEVMKELDFQMIRLDTISKTKDIRELLIARALYATCIEPEREPENVDEEKINSDWESDINGIFASRTPEK